MFEQSKIDLTLSLLNIVEEKRFLITVPAGISGGGETISQMQRIENGAQAKMKPEALIRVSCWKNRISVRDCS